MGKAARVTISGVGRLRKVFEDRRRKADSGSVAVGYTAAYAIYVHENVGANFQRPGAQAKFLEQPARELMPKLPRNINRHMSSGKTMTESLLIEGLQLQRTSQELVPVDTGNLRASAFTRLE